MGVPESSGKPFDISKRDVWDAWVKVKTNQGAPGVDEQSIADFETDLKNNLYKVWNRMSSGSYFPAPVRAVEILKPHGGGVHVGHPDGRRPGRPDGSGQVSGRAGGTGVPPRFLRLPPGPLGAGCGRGLPEAVLAERLGDRHRHRSVLRHRRLGPRAGRGRCAHRHRLGAAVCEALARGTAAARRWHADPAASGNPAGVTGVTGAGEPVRPLRGGSVACP
jgi:hypothetical protein